VASGQGEGAPRILDGCRIERKASRDQQEVVEQSAEEQTADFGFQRVPIEEKARLVGAIFDSLASRYDLVNDVMSFGMHRLWRRFAIQLCEIGPGDRVLDLAGGTGDLTSRLSRALGPEGLAVLAEINDSMLQMAERRFSDGNYAGVVELVQADAEHVPFPDDSFDAVTIGFGMRNVTRKEAVLRSMIRVLKPGRRAVVLEFSQPTMWGFAPLYDFYSFHIMPLLGRLASGDGDGFRYLAESIRVYPDQETFKTMMESAGFQRCLYHNLSGGIVSVHCGFKPR
jgi:demethylmenaquinone methyltransferase/2-methoxy-6-polyprenyl-1,4-benzoquinol methylase